MLTWNAPLDKEDCRLIVIVFPLAETEHLVEV
jgi:hypothetical protein